VRRFFCGFFGGILLFSEWGHWQSGGFRVDFLGNKAVSGWISPVTRWFQSGFPQQSVVFGELGTNRGKSDSYTKDCMQSFEEIKKTGIDYQKTVIHT
jgi:hypothetical protein